MHNLHRYLILLLFFIHSCTSSDKEQNQGQTKTKNQNNSDSSNLYKRSLEKLETADFHIQYPSNWELQQDNEFKTTFVLLAPSEDRYDPFRENIVLNIDRFDDQNVDLNAYSNAVEIQVLKYLKESQLLESKRTFDMHGDYHVLRYTGYEEGVQYFFEQHIRMQGNAAYCLTFTAENQNYYDYKETGEVILASFYLK